MIISNINRKINLLISPHSIIEAVSTSDDDEGYQNHANQTPYTLMSFLLLQISFDFFSSLLINLLGLTNLLKKT